MIPMPNVGAGLPDQTYWRATVWLAAGRGRLWTGTAISGLTGGALGAPAPFPKDLIRLGPPRLLWPTRRRFDPSSSPSATHRRADFSINEKAENLPTKGGFSRVATVLEIAEWRHFRLGDGIFLQSFVLRHFRIVPKGQGQSDNLQRRFLGVRISLGRARATRLEPN
jgi:hypothetical protein